MAASLVGLSIPALEKRLLNDLFRLSLISSSRRHVCMKCHKRQSILTGKSMMSLKQVSIPSVCNITRRHCATGTTSFRHHRFPSVFPSNTAQGFLPCSHISDSLLSSNSAPCSLSRFFHNLRRVPPQHALSDIPVFHNPSILTASENHYVPHMRQFHSSHSLSSSSTSSTSTTNTTLSQATEDVSDVARAAAVDPFKMMESELKDVLNDLRKELVTEVPLLQHLSQYYFNGKGKTFRPLVALLMARACNIHNNGNHDILWEQKIVAMVSEMIHTASLVHDDVIDESDTRRSQASLYKLYGQRQAVLTGDYILSQASIAVSRTRNPQVIKVLSSILVDLVDGEFMQLGSKENENERFTHYYAKTYKKTASLISNCCKSVAILGDCDEEMSELCFQYGRNLGLAFQFIDDLLDFTATYTDMGKPTDSDLKQGMATAPVLFAAQEFPELHAMIMRRFSQEGDVEFARNAVEKSDGIERTRLLATQHSKEAIRNIQTLTDSEAKQGLVRLAQILLERKK